MGQSKSQDCCARATEGAATTRMPTTTKTQESFMVTQFRSVHTGNFTTAQSRLVVRFLGVKTLQTLAQIEKMTKLKEEEKREHKKVEGLGIKFWVGDPTCMK